MKQNRTLTFAILSISMITVMASAAVSPALANISNAFPDADNNLIKTILTLPSLFIIPFSIISGYLVQRYGNKRILIIGILIYIIGGVMPAFVNTMTGLLAFRAILGCGCGLIMPVSQALIAINFQGPLKARITGYSGAASYLMGVIASFIVAPVSAIDWHYSFYIYLIAILVLILNIFFLPNDKPSGIAKSNSSKKLSPKVWWFIVGMLFINIAFYAVPANVALFMKEQQIGGNQSAGTVISGFMIAGFLAGLVLPFIRRQFRSYTIIFGISVMALGYMILSFSGTLIPVMIGAICVGFSFGVLFPSMLLLITNACSRRRSVWALSLASCAQFLGQFLSPYILQFIKNVLDLSSLRDDFVILAVVLTIYCCIHILAKEKVPGKIWSLMFANKSVQ